MGSIRTNPGVRGLFGLEIFGKLKRAGVPMHAISNYNREEFDIARLHFPFINDFDELVLSGDVGVVKPDPEIFELLVRRRNLDVGRTVFIDDNIANVVTADQLGFATIHFDEKTTDLRAELLRLGLKDAKTRRFRTTRMSSWAVRRPGQPGTACRACPGPPQ
jgi:2-haloacid dehalogenase